MWVSGEVGEKDKESNWQNIQVCKKNIVNLHRQLLNYKQIN